MVELAAPIICLIRFFITHEAISSALAGLSVCDDHRLSDVTERLEVATKSLVGCVVRKTADENLGERRVTVMYAAP